MNVSLTEQQERYISDRVASGRYRSAAEVVREGLRLLMEKDRLDAQRAEVWRAEVRRKIDQGFHEALRGELVDGDKALESLRKKIGKRGRKRG